MPKAPHLTSRCGARQVGRKLEMLLAALFQIACHRDERREIGACLGSQIGLNNRSER
jgi:hypothetical protein